MNHRKWNPRHAGQPRGERRAPYSELHLRKLANDLLATMISDPPMFIDKINAKKRVITLGFEMFGTSMGNIQFNDDPDAGNTITIDEKTYEFTSDRGWIVQHDDQIDK